MTETVQLDFQSYIATAHALAERAGEVILPHFRSGVAVDDKGGGAFDPVTVADRDAEAAIREILADAYPGHGVVGEEFEDSQPDAEFCWIVDPIDGTKGFLRGDQYAVALALVVDSRVVVGVLGCPKLGLTPGHGSPGVLVAATRGAGATIESLHEDVEVPARVDAITDTAQAVLCESVEAAHAAHSVQAAIARRLGITAEPYRIDSQCKYAVVASGEASIYLRLPRDTSYREKAWDHAAGSIVVEEAGGRVTDLDGQPLDFSQGRLLANSRGIVCTNGALHQEVLEACRGELGL